MEMFRAIQNVMLQLSYFFSTVLGALVALKPAKIPTVSDQNSEFRTGGAEYPHQPSRLFLVYLWGDSHPIKAVDDAIMASSFLSGATVDGSKPVPTDFTLAFARCGYCGRPLM